jgi:hypothetical protein
LNLGGPTAATAATTLGAFQDVAVITRGSPIAAAGAADSTAPRPAGATDNDLERFRNAHRDGRNGFRAAATWTAQTGLTPGPNIRALAKGPGSAHAAQGFNCHCAGERGSERECAWDIEDPPQQALAGNATHAIVWVTLTGTGTATGATMLGACLEAPHRDAGTLTENPARRTNTAAPPANPASRSRAAVGVGAAVPPGNAPRPAALLALRTGRGRRLVEAEHGGHRAKDQRPERRPSGAQPAS